MSAAATVILAVVMTAAGTERPMLEGIHWLGHDAVRIDGPPVVYIDPFQLSEGGPPADLILITHGHHDHCSPDDVAGIRAPHTVIVATADAAAKLPGPVEVIAPGDECNVAGARIVALPAYNLAKRFHPKSAGGVGYVVTVSGVTVYHAGDTDLIPEMRGLKPDIAFLPVSGTYVMTADEAALAARAIGPKVAVPMHYGAIIGSGSDADTFRSLLADAGFEVAILPKE